MYGWCRRYQSWYAYEQQTKEHKDFFSARAVGAASPSHHGHVTQCRVVQVRKQKSISEKHRSGRSAPSWALSPCTPAAGMMGWMDCDSMLALPWRLPMQDLGRILNYLSVPINHVH